MDSIILLFILNVINLIKAYNIDTEFFSMYTGPNHSYFGYSLEILQLDNELKIAVGAPTYLEPSNTKMVFYICEIQDTNNCKPFNIHINRHEPVTETGRWLGASMDIFPHDRLVICSPLRQETLDQLPGFCYIINSASSSSQILPKLPQSSFVNNIAGMSLRHSEDDKYIIGALNYRQDGGGAFIVNGLHTDSSHSSFAGYGLEYSGYAVTFGKYYSPSKSEIYYAVGAPRFNDCGKVDIIIYDYLNARRARIQETIQSQELGEYFGASLDTLSGKYLLIGAPLYGGRTYDEGRVYVYLYSESIKKMELNGELLLGSQKPGSRFGSNIVVVGDLDINYYPDVVISAPYEDDGKGAIYIYYSDSYGLRRRPEQLIRAKDFPNTLGLGFGTGISRSRDVDNNGYPDFAVGAFASNNAVLFRTREIIEVKSYMRSDPDKINTKSENCKQKLKTCFEITVCFDTYGKRAKLDYSLQSDYLRINPRAKFYYKEKSELVIIDTIIIDGGWKCLDPFQVQLIIQEQELKPDDLSSPIGIKLNFSLSNEQPDKSKHLIPVRPILNDKHVTYNTFNVPFAPLCNNTQKCAKSRAKCEEALCHADLQINVNSTLKDICSNLLYFKCPAECLEMICEMNCNQVIDMVEQPCKYFTTFDFVKELVFAVSITMQGQVALQTQIKLMTNTKVESIQAKSYAAGSDLQRLLTCDQTKLVCDTGNLMNDKQRIDFFLHLKLGVPIDLEDLVITLSISSASFDNNLINNNATIFMPIREVADITGYSESAEDEYCDLKLKAVCSTTFTFVIRNLGPSIIKESEVDVLMPSFTNNLFQIIPDEKFKDNCTVNESIDNSEDVPLFIDSAIDCQDKKCSKLFSCNFTNLQRNSDITISFILIFKSDEINRFKKIKKLSIAATVNTHIITTNQPKLIQIYEHQTDIFQVNRNIIFGLKSVAFPILPVALGSVFGLLLLIIILIIFIRCGFFKRQMKTDLKEQRKSIRLQNNTVTQETQEEAAVIAVENKNSIYGSTQAIVEN